MALKFRDFIRVKKKVIQVSGQFAQYNDPKWNLINALSFLMVITKLQSSANYPRRGSNGHKKKNSKKNSMSKKQTREKLIHKNRVSAPETTSGLPVAQ